MWKPCARARAVPAGHQGTADAGADQSGRHIEGEQLARGRPGRGQLLGPRGDIRVTGRTDAHPADDRAVPLGDQIRHLGRPAPEPRPPLLGILCHAHRVQIRLRHQPAVGRLPAVHPHRGDRFDIGFGHLPYPHGARRLRRGALSSPIHAGEGRGCLPGTRKELRGSHAGDSGADQGSDQGQLSRFRRVAGGLAVVVSGRSGVGSGGGSRRGSPGWVGPMPYSVASSWTWRVMRRWYHLGA